MKWDKDLKVAIAKGYITYDELLGFIELFKDTIVNG